MIECLAVLRTAKAQIDVIFVDLKKVMMIETSAIVEWDIKIINKEIVILIGDFDDLFRVIWRTIYYSFVLCHPRCVFKVRQTIAVFTLCYFEKCNRALLFKIIRP